MNTILLLLDNKENCNLLAEWLAAYYQVLLPDEDSPQPETDSSLPPLDRVFYQKFDLCILDGRALTRRWEQAQARKAAEQPPLILPFLLIVSRQDIGLATHHLWQSIDELIIAPIEKVELQARVEILLRARNLSVALKAANQQLENEAIERQRAAEALAESEAKFRSLIQNSLDNITVIEKDGTIRYENPSIEQILGFLPSELEGRKVCEFIHPEDLPKTRELFREGLNNPNNSIVLEYRIRHKDGSWHYFESRSNFLGSAESENGIVVNSRDVTERKLAEAEIIKALEKERELRELKANFVSMVSHQFRNPLTAIVLGIELLQISSTKLFDEQKVGHLERIKAAANQMMTLLNNVLTIGKSEAGRLEFNPVLLDLEKLCRDLVEEIQLSVGVGYTIAFIKQEASIASPGSLVRMDEQLVRHIITNLLSNAIKYSPKGSVVQFELICQDREAIFHIRDQGIGIPLEDQPYLFESFRRGKNVGKIPGTGLGLKIVKQCVDLHGGAIAIASQSGMGCTITVTLPIGSAISTSNSDIMSG